MSIPFSHGRPLPLEILEKIAYELVAASPLGAPSQIIPLLQTNRAVHQALSIQKSGTQLYSHICRFKFDVGAVTRRAFVPGVKDLNGHLIQMCYLLRFIRRGDIDSPDVEDQLLIAYIAMLDNDGKNRAQLRDAGIEDLVDRLVRLRLHDGMEANDMWPEASIANSCALWLMWMFTTRESLQRESPQQREHIIRLVFPYISCPFRYACAFVPPNHFTLPLGSSNPVQSDLFTTETAHGSFPLYHIIRARPQTLWYFRCNPSFLVPLIAPVAKLLYWSRREIVSFFQNPMLPATRADLGRAGLTQEDLADFNRHKVAKLLDDVVWDWDKGKPVCRFEDGSYREWKEDESAKWDTNWWRARLCDDIFFKQPKWRLGSIYLRGMLTGLWQGVQFTRSVASLNEMLLQAQRPVGYSEESVMFGARPLLMRLTEHGFIRTPSSNTKPPIPCATATGIPITISGSEGPDQALVPIDASLGNAWFPGPTGSLKWAEGGEPLDEGVFRDRFVGSEKDGKGSMTSTTFVVSTQEVGASTGVGADVGGPVEARVLRSEEGNVFVYEAYDAERKSVHERMVRAKERGELCRVDGESVTKIRHPGCSRCVERKEFLANRRERDSQRGRSLFRGRKEVEDMFESVGLGKQRETNCHLMNSHYPYEDKGARPYAMDVEDEDDDEEDEMELLELDFEGDDNNDDEDEEEQEDEPLLMSPVPSSAAPPSPSVSTNRSLISSSTRDEDGDSRGTSTEVDVDYDYEQGHPGVCDSLGELLSNPLRRSHDRYRVEQCDDGVEDVVITGDLTDKHQFAWGKSTYYGRVRPWDGLIAILRISYDRNTEANTFMIYYGYIYGGDTFVGNWKYAGADPLMPGFECSFVMSKRLV